MGIVDVFSSLSFFLSSTFFLQVHSMERGEFDHPVENLGFGACLFE